MEKKEHRVRVGSAGEQSVPNKANLQKKTRAGRPRHEAPYGVTTSVTDCTNKANSAAGVCVAIRGQRGRGPQSRCIGIGNPRPPYHAKQSQFAESRHETGGRSLEGTSRNKADSGGRGRREILYRKGVMFDRAMMRNRANLAGREFAQQLGTSGDARPTTRDKANLQRAGMRREAVGWRELRETKPIWADGLGNGRMGVASRAEVW